jgi:hypothetical protein
MEPYRPLTRNNCALGAKTARGGEKQRVRQKSGVHGVFGVASATIAPCVSGTHGFMRLARPFLSCTFLYRTPRSKRSGLKNGAAEYTE